MLGTLPRATLTPGSQSPYASMRSVSQGSQTNYNSASPARAPLGGQTCQKKSIIGNEPAWMFFVPLPPLRSKFMNVRTCHSPSLGPDLPFRLTLPFCSGHRINDETWGGGGDENSSLQRCRLRPREQIADESNYPPAENKGMHIFARVF